MAIEFRFIIPISLSTITGYASSVGNSDQSRPFTHTYRVWLHLAVPTEAAYQPLHLGLEHTDQ